MKKKKSFFLLPLLLSGAFHVTLMVLSLYSWNVFWKSAKNTSPAKKKTDVVVMDKEQVEELLKRMKNKAALPPKENRAVIDKSKMQIVNNQTSEVNEKTPVKTRFLGEKNQSFEKQSVARKVDSFNDGDGIPKSELERTRKDQSTKNLAKGDKGLAAEAGASKTKAPTKAKSAVKIKNDISDLKLSDIGFNPQDQGNIGDEKAKMLSNKDSTLNEDPAAFAAQKKGRGISSNNDFIEDVPLGEATNLNTVQFKYFGFYSRIRGQLEQYWGKSLREKAEILSKKGRNLASNENYITSLKIMIDDKGNIVKVMVVNSSGEKDLDDAAIESFRRAGPFPNPPKGMMGEGGVATIEWGFVVKS